MSRTRYGVPVQLEIDHALILWVKSRTLPVTVVESRVLKRGGIFCKFQYQLELSLDYLNSSQTLKHLFSPDIQVGHPKKAAGESRQTTSVVVKGFKVCKSDERDKDLMEKLVDWFEIANSVKVTKAVRMTRWDKVLKKRVPMKMILLDGESHEGFKIVTERGKVKLGCEVFPLEVFKPRERLPPRCFKCQGLGHVTQFCKGDETCMRCSEKVTDENKTMHGKACKQELKCVNCGKGHGAWSKECPNKMRLVNNLRERKSIMKGTEQEVLQFLRQLFKCCGMKKFNELIMNGMGQYAAN